LQFVEFSTKSLQTYKKLPKVWFEWSFFAGEDYIGIIGHGIRLKVLGIKINSKVTWIRLNFLGLRIKILNFWDQGSMFQTYNLGSKWLLSPCHHPEFL